MELDSLVVSSDFRKTRGMRGARGRALWFLAPVFLLCACAHNASAEFKAPDRKRTQLSVTFHAMDLADTGPPNGEIMPTASKSKLQWKVEVEPKKGGSLGWKTTVYVAGFFVLKAPGARNVLCYSRIGVPMRNRLGPVPDAFAEEAILDAGQVVGTQMQEELRAKDPEEMLPAESICLAFRQRLMAKLKTVIPGIRVENFPTRQ
jgi:hypothetical protein